MSLDYPPRDFVRIGEALIAQQGPSNAVDERQQQCGQCDANEQPLATRVSNHVPWKAASIAVAALATFPMLSRVKELTIASFPPCRNMVILKNDHGNRALWASVMEKARCILTGHDRAEREAGIDFLRTGHEVGEKSDSVAVSAFGIRRINGSTILRGDLEIIIVMYQQIDCEIGVYGIGYVRATIRTAPLLRSRRIQ